MEHISNYPTETSSILLYCLIDKPDFIPPFSVCSPLIAVVVAKSLDMEVDVVALYDC